MSSRCLELIHVDIWGPMPFVTYGNHKYFLTIVDDFSRCTWLFFLVNWQKPGCTYNILQLLFSMSIQKVRSDNGQEFNIPCYFVEKGIIHQTSCVYTPKRNSVVEQKHQHILNVARALKFQSGLPDKFWGDCIMHAVYLINRTPSPVLYESTPLEILFQKLPDYDHLKVFACLCLVGTPAAHRHIFDSRSIKCVFLGFKSGIKGYKLLNLDTQQILFSRDVHFYELEFPYASATSLDQNIDSDLFSYQSSL